MAGASDVGSAADNIFWGVGAGANLLFAWDSFVVVLVKTLVLSISIPPRRILMRTRTKIGSHSCGSGEQSRLRQKAQPRLLRKARCLGRTKKKRETLQRCLGHLEKSEAEDILLPL